MNKTKHEIAAPMLDAATAAILRAQEFGTGEDDPEYARENFKRLSLYPAWQQAERYTKAALEAAGVAEMAAREARLLELVGSADAETAITYLEDKFRGRDPQTAQMEARIAELEGGIAELGGIIEAHDVRLESCDRDGNEFCDCLTRAIKKLNAPSGAGGE